MQLFDKILIANRGEIAVRIIKTAQKLSIKTVVIYSTADAHSLAVSLADEAFPLHSNVLSESYLNIGKIIEIAEISGAEAIHPGYGFLSENPFFVAACEDAGLVFIGPDAQVMHLMGNKIESRNFVSGLSIPMTKGFTGTPEEILSQQDAMQFPVLIKAAAGGGGKGMRIIYAPHELQDALIATSREALNYFNDASIYVEKFIENPRHIEMQILADQHGHVVHLFERECSIQRRYQKIIEEAPAIGVSPELRARIAEAALSIAQATNYTNAGTIEFLADAAGNFYFLEMNTRIQVEHPVTEYITGIDIVEEQLRIAAGYPLSFSQQDIHATGHSIECRIYAEDSENHFLPSPGTISHYQVPQGNGIRLDSGIAGPSEIHSFYDPMISKLIVHGADRQHAILKMTHALECYSIQGIKTNIPYLLSILHDEVYLENKIWTKFCESNLSNSLDITKKLRESADVNKLIAIAVYSDLLHRKPDGRESIWNMQGYWRNLIRFSVSHDNQIFTVEVEPDWKSTGKIYINNICYYLELIHFKGNTYKYLVNQKHLTIYINYLENNKLLVFHKGFTYQIIRQDLLDSSPKLSYANSQVGPSYTIKSPMPGKVIGIKCEEGQFIQKGDVLVIVESMKMENNLVSTMDGEIESILARIGDMVDSSRVLIKLKEE